MDRVLNRKVQTLNPTTVSVLGPQRERADRALNRKAPTHHGNWTSSTDSAATLLFHPAGTSKDLDICDLSNISDIKICIVGNGNIHIFKDKAYLSKDLGEIYI